MISDVLCEAVADLDHYLDSFNYQGDLRKKIVRLRDEMDAVRRELDAVPTPKVDLEALGL